MFPIPNPIINIDTNAVVFPGAKNTPNTPASESMVVSIRKTRGFIQFKMIAPSKREMVSPAKNRLIPMAAFSSVIPYFAMRILEILVLIETSAPTIKKIDKAINATKRFLSNPRQDANEAGLRSGFDSVIGVIESHKAANNEVTP